MSAVWRVAGGAILAVSYLLVRFVQSGYESWGLSPELALVILLPVMVAVAYGASFVAMGDPADA